jgi:hypothetical protein
VEREPDTTPRWRTFQFLDLAQYWARSVTQMVSFYLCGKYRAPERLPDVLSKLVGSEAAQTVIALIPARQERSTA